MAFDKNIKEEAFVKCNRHCCICGKFCGTKIEPHHIKPLGEGGDNSLGNCIPLCFDCHEDVHTPSGNPRGNTYTQNELRKLRDKAYEKHSEIEKISLKIDTI